MDRQDPHPISHFGKRCVAVAWRPVGAPSHGVRPLGEERISLGWRAVGQRDQPLEVRASLSAVGQRVEHGGVAGAVHEPGDDHAGRSRVRASAKAFEHGERVGESGGLLRLELHPGRG